MAARRLTRSGWRVCEPPWPGRTPHAQAALPSTQELSPLSLRHVSDPPNGYRNDRYRSPLVLLAKHFTVPPQKECSSPGSERAEKTDGMGSASEKLAWWPAHSGARDWYLFESCPARCPRRPMAPPFHTGDCGAPAAQQLELVPGGS